jgi:hypothetical protein
VATGENVFVSCFIMAITNRTPILLFDCVSKPRPSAANIVDYASLHDATQLAQAAASAAHCRSWPTGGGPVAPQTKTAAMSASGPGCVKM